MQVVKVYWLPAFFIIFWWALALKNSSQAQFTDREQIARQIEANKAQYNISSISFIKRDQLQAALSGDVDTMLSLILNWDIEAQMMSQISHGKFQRISPEGFLRSQVLGRHMKMKHNLNTSSTSETLPFESYLYKTCCEKQNKRFLPQTYAAASLLLAIAEPDSIVALPGNMRSETQLYPLSLTQKIPLDIDRYNSEKLHLMAPSIAFVASYSQPTTVQALKDQGIVLHTMGNLNSILEISQEILAMGAIVEQPQKAELLTLFIEAAMCAIDNQLSLLTERLIAKWGGVPKVLFLNHFQQYSVPSPSSLTGQLLEKIALFDITLQYATATAPGDNWVVPIGKEQIVNLNPDCILIVTENKRALQHEILADKSLCEVVAVKNDRIFFLDEATQHSPSQYTVLAYHDLIEALTQLL